MDWRVQGSGGLRDLFDEHPRGGYLPLEFDGPFCLTLGYHPHMEKRGQAIDRHGRVWAAHVLSEHEAEEEDFRFWYEEMTPEERVRAVEECLLSSLRAKGINEIPRLRRVCRILERNGSRCRVVAIRKG